jgi:hypothetical protein
VVCKRDELLAPAVEKGVAANQKPLHSHLDKSLEGDVNVLRFARLQDVNLPAKRASRFFDIF